MSNIFAQLVVGAFASWRALVHLPVFGGVDGFRLYLKQN